MYVCVYIYIQCAFLEQLNIKPIEFLQSGYQFKTSSAWSSRRKPRGWEQNMA